MWETVSIKIREADRPEPRPDEEGTFEMPAVSGVPSSVMKSIEKNNKNNSDPSGWFCLADDDDGQWN